jgi:hypothetical protein
LSILVVSTVAVVGNVVVASGASADSQVIFVGTAKDDPRFTVNGDSSRTSSAFAVTGVLVDDEGVPVAETRLSVNLDPSPAMLVAAEPGPQGAAGLPLSVVKTDADGNFSLPVPALRDIEQYVDSDGTVMLLFMSFGSGQDLMLRQSVWLPQNTGDAALATLDNEQVFRSKQTATTRAESRTGTAVPELKEITLTAKRTPARANAVSPSSECTRTWGSRPWGSYQWKREGSPTRNWVPVQHVETGGKTRVTYEWSNTRETSIETAVNYEYKNVGARGGFSKSVVTSAGVNFSLGNYYTRDLDVSFDFYNYRLWCALSGDATNLKDSKVVEIRPYKFAGYNRSTTYRFVYSCTASYRGPLGHALWVSRKRVHLFEGWSFWGFSVMRRG